MHVSVKAGVADCCTQVVCDKPLWSQQQEVPQEVALFLILAKASVTLVFFSVGCPFVRGLGQQVDSQWCILIVLFIYCV
jgi:hypothetical protein